MQNNLRLALAAIVLPVAVSAGGYVPPSVTPAVIAPSEEVVTQRGWGGAYIGGAIGYKAIGDDRVGRETVLGGIRGGTVDETGRDLDVNGAVGSIALGYRWQRGNMVFGPEIAADFGNVEDEASETYLLQTGTVRSKVNHTVSLRLKGGRLIDQQTLVYALAGVARGDFTYALKMDPDPRAISQEVDYDDTRYVLGAGVERKFGERLSVVGEWNYYNFSRTDIVFGDPVGADTGVQTVATPSHHLFKLGLNLQF